VRLDDAVTCRAHRAGRRPAGGRARHSVGRLWRARTDVWRHGGDAAAIASATFRAYSHAATPQRVTLRSARWLVGGQCNVPSEGTALPDAHLDQDLVIAPNASASFSVSFAPQHAYQGWCDRFAIELELELDVAGNVLRPVAEIHVSRVERQH
jgi:hypothetical protein